MEDMEDVIDREWCGREGGWWGERGIQARVDSGEEDGVRKR